MEYNDDKSHSTLLGFFTVYLNFIGYRSVFEKGECEKYNAKCKTSVRFSYPQTSIVQWAF